MPFLPNGLGDYPTGDSLAHARPLLTSGDVWYVSSATGVDAVSPAGLNAGRPLATLAQAVTNAADHDIIVLVEHHVERLTTALTIDKALTIVGSMATGGYPGSWLSREGGASANLLTITAAGVQLRNLCFPQTDTSAVATERIVVSGARFKMVGCTVLCGPYDTGPALMLSSGADQAEIQNCAFTAYSLATGPESAIKSTAAITQLRITDTTVSAGNTSWSNYYAVELVAPVTRVEVENLGLLLGSDMKLHSDCTGWVHVALATGGARVDWPYTGGPA